MKARTAIRKSVKWGGAVAVVLVVAVWVASGWWLFEWYPTLRSFFHLSYGRLQVVKYVRSALVAPVPACAITPLGPERYLTGRFDWSFDYYIYPPPRSGGYFVIPLWFPTLALVFVTTLAWRADRRATRLARIGRCLACGYDRRGLAAGAVCPECGAAANRGAAS